MKKRRTWIPVKLAVSDTCLIEKNTEIVFFNLKILFNLSILCTLSQWFKRTMKVVCNLAD